MLKLNKKGYITIEVILSSVLAFAVAFFLIDITVKLVNKTDDAYLDTVLMADKTLIIKNIKECIEKDIADYGNISELKYLNQKATNIIYIKFSNGTVRYLSTVNNHVRFYMGSTTYYEKKLNSNLRDLSITFDKNDSYVFITIKATNIFSDKNNNINIPIYNG